MSKHIIKIPFEASKKNISPDLLLCIIPTSSTSTTLSDLVLEATEGQTPFTGTLHSSRLSKLLDKEAGISVPQLEAILTHLLLQQPLQHEYADLADIKFLAVQTRDREAVTGVRLRLRREIGDIVHWLGEITLKADFDAEIDVCEWARLAVEHGTVAERELHGLKMRLREAEDAVGRVKAQLGELLAVKKDDEEVLLGKFVQVLNAKKARIRELELELGRGGRPWPEVDEDLVKEEDVEEVKPARGNGRGRGRGRGAKAGPSRTGKRKQTQTEPEPEVVEDMQMDDEDEDDEENARKEAEDADTDKERLEDLPDDAVDSDDLDAPDISQHTRTGELKGKGRETQPKNPQDDMRSGAARKQHVHRTRQKSPVINEQDDASTDDEL